MFQTAARYHLSRAVDAFGNECLQIGFVQLRELVRAACFGELFLVFLKIRIAAVENKNHHGLVLGCSCKRQKLITVNIRYAFEQRLIVPDYDYPFFL